MSISFTGSYCDLTFNVNGNYNITWQAPAGWTISSSSDKGSNVTFVPDDYTDGDISATIHFTGCNDFTETRINSNGLSKGVYLIEIINKQNS